MQNTDWIQYHNLLEQDRWLEQCSSVINKNGYIAFWGKNKEFGFLSNWYRSNMIYRTYNNELEIISEIEFNCVEQWIMYQKAILFNDLTIASKILETKEPRIQKQLGRSINNFNEDIWNKHKYKILYDGLKLKFEQNDKLHNLLRNTENKILIEASPYDSIYGVGMSANDPNISNPQKWKGLNMLGRALMDIRKNLQ